MKQFLITGLPRVNSSEGTKVVIQGEDYHYLARVRRVKEGDSFVVRDGETQYQAKVLTITSESLQLSLDKETFIPVSGTKIHLFSFLLKGRKLEDVIRAAGEAGVSSFTPVEGKNCVARWKTEGSKTLARWQAISKEASQQSGNRVCEIYDCISSQQILTAWNNKGPLLIFHETPLAKGSLHRYLVSQPQDIGLVIGPEGGLSDQELALLQNDITRLCWLGPGVLRAETANIYAIAAVKIILQEHSEWNIRT